MPYIQPPRRPPLDPIIDGLIKRLLEIKCKKGDVNYTVTRIAVEALNQHGYHSISDCISVLRDAADEIARRLLGPYEDTAIIRNGDLACFQTSYAYHPLEFVGEPCVGPARMNEVDGNVVTDSPLRCDDVPPLAETTARLIDKYEASRARREAEAHCLDMSSLVSSTNTFCDNNPEACEGCGPTDD